MNKNRGGEKLLPMRQRGREQLAEKKAVEEIKEKAPLLKKRQKVKFDLESSKNDILIMISY